MALRGYFDETGHPKDRQVRVFGIIGCVAPAEAWERFDRTWSAVLAGAGVPSFHATDFRNRRRQFSPAQGWNEARRAGFFSRLLECINTHVTEIVGFSRWLDTAQPANRTVREDYLLLHELLIRQVMANAQERVDFVFARHPEVNPLEHHRTLRTRLLEESPRYERLGTLTLAEAAATAPLQAADLIALEVQRWNRDQPRIPALVHGPRWSFRWT